MKIRHCLILVMLAGWVHVASAQVQVRDLNAPRGGNAQPPTGGNTTTEVLVNMNDRLTALEQETQMLRGIVEEQAYQIKRMQAEAKDRYLDIDRRLSAGANSSGRNSSSAPQATPPPSLDASSAAANSAVTVATIPPPAPVTPARGNDRRAAPADSNPLDEQQLYRTALNLLLDDHKPEETKPRALEAVAMFQNYIDSYPNGRLLTNALYWQGDGYMIVGNPAKAKDVLTRLLTDFPADAKAAGAMLMLGDAYKQLGDKAKAAETWKSIRARYPDADDENKKADAYLKSL
jgi:TolA-binding protein